MSTRTATGKGLAKPHKSEAAKPGIGSNMANAKTINTERSPKGEKSHGGVARTYYGNSKACNTE